MDYDNTENEDDAVVETPGVDETQGNPAADVAAAVPRSIAIVRPHVMAAMAVIMSSETTRYYLNGIFIEPHKEGGIVLTATDGHLLVTVRDLEGFADGPARIWRYREFASVITAKLRNASKFMKDTAKLRYQHIGPTQGGHDFQVALACGSVEDARDTAWGSKFCEFIGADAAIDGTFPEYGRVIPRIGETRTGSVFQSELLARIAKFAQTISGEKACAVGFEITDETGPSCFHVSGSTLDAVGVIMPMRGQRMHHHPSWLVEHTGRSDLAPPAPTPIVPETAEDAEPEERVAQAA